MEEFKKLEEKCIKIIVSVKMFIDGLSFGEDGLLFEGLLFIEK